MDHCIRPRARRRNAGSKTGSRPPSSLRLRSLRLFNGEAEQIVRTRFGTFLAKQERKALKQSLLSQETFIA